MKVFLFIAVSMLAGCYLQHDYNNQLYCFGGNAYVIEPRIGDLVYMRPTPAANQIGKESK